MNIIKDMQPPLPPPSWKVAKLGFWSKMMCNLWKNKYPIFQIYLVDFILKILGKLTKNGQIFSSKNMRNFLKSMKQFSIFSFWDSYLRSILCSKFIEKLPQHGKFFTQKMKNYKKNCPQIFFIKKIIQNQIKNSIFISTNLTSAHPLLFGATEYRYFWIETPYQLVIRYLGRYQ